MASLPHDYPPYLTPPSDQPGPRWHHRPAGTVVVALLTGLIALSGLYTGLAQSERRPFNLVVAAFMAGTTVVLLAGLGGRGARWASARLADDPAVRLRLGPGRLSSAAAAFTTLVLGGGLGWAAVAMVLDPSGGSDDRAGQVVVGVLLGLVALFLLVVGLSLGLAVVRDPGFLVSADRLRHAGAGVVVDVAWDDVGTVEQAHLDGRWACLRISARRGAASLVVRRRWTLLTLDRVPTDGIELRLGLLPDPAQLQRLLREMHLGDRATRASYVDLGPEFVARR